MKSTDVNQFISDLDGGQLEADLGKILTATGIAVCDFDGDGEVIIKLAVKRIGNSNQVNIKHLVSYTKPTSRGKQSEKTAGETAMYVSASQGMTFFPSRGNQGTLLSKNGESSNGGEMPPQ